MVPLLGRTYCRFFLLEFPPEVKWNSRQNQLMLLLLLSRIVFYFYK